MNISRNISIFLIATILVFETTISMGIPASFAQSQYYNEQQYNEYEDYYGKEYDKSSGVNLQKVKCNNINNIIINGVDSLGQDTGDMLDSGMRGEEDNDWTGQQDGQWSWNGDKESNGIDKNIINYCQNKNKIVEVEGEQGLQGPPGITTINSSNVYQIRVAGIFDPTLNSLDGIAQCDTGDFPLGGGFIFDGDVDSDFKVIGNDYFGLLGWRTTIALPGLEPLLTVTVNCFDNPPVHTP